MFARKIEVSCLIIVLAASSLAAQAEEVEPTGTDKVEEQKTAIGPVMSLESMVVDYGEINQGDDPVRVVSFTNTGTEPLVISNARGSCGCTVPTYPREPIAPGDSAEIKIRYDTKRPGKINKTVRLTTNDATGQYVLRVVGNVSKKPAEEGLPEKKGILNPNN